VRKESLAFLRALLSTPSPSGFEHQVQRVWLDYVASLADESYSDTYGNAVAVLNPGGSPRVMIVGHADEVGLIVRHIDERGFIYPAAIGGLDPAALIGKRYTIHTAKGPVTGVSGSTAVHLLEKKADRRVGKVHEVFIDIGVKDEKAARRLVSIGDPITAAVGFEVLQGSVAIARAFDNSIGTWAAAETLRLLRRSRGRLQAAVYAVSAVREETGAKCSQQVARQIDADIALVADVGHATDTPGVDQRQFGRHALGGGPKLVVGGPILLEMRDRLLGVARREKIPIQPAVNPIRSGSDADAIFIATEGVATGLVNLPLRYMHTNVEMIDMKDLEVIPRLFAAFCTSLRKGEKIKARI